MAMKRERWATLVAGGAVLVAWAAAASFPDAPVTQSPPPVRASEPRAAASVEVDTAQLRARLAGVKPGLKAPVRNPFRFAQRGAGQTRPDPSARQPALSTAAAVPPPLPLVLAGIAQQGDGTGTQRTAVISDFTHLYLVREGEPVADRYRVERIGADAVELRDGLTGTTVRLGLR